MSFKDLSSAQMIHLTATWLDPAKSRPKLQSMKRVAPLLPDIEEAHAAVLATHRKDASADKALAAVQTKQADLDKVHDRKARGVYGVLTAFADLTDDPAEAEAFLETRDLLYPEGLRFITASYADEAGAASFAKDRLTADAKATLKAVVSPGGTLLKCMQASWAAAAELGALEEQRGTLESMQAQARVGDAAKTPQGGQLRARNHWIATVRAVVQMLELERPGKQVRAEVLGPLERALSKAERRGGGSSIGPDEEVAEDAAGGAGTVGNGAPEAKPDGA
jgi:hypothetical protein